jgi:hypothetical protein
MGALTWVVTVTDVNEAPTAIALSATTIASAAPVGTDVGTLSVTDPDLGDTHVFTLVAGAGATDNASFAIVGSTVKTAAAGLTLPLSIRVRATDSGGLWTEQVFAVTAASGTATGGASTGGVTMGGAIGGSTGASGGGCGLGGSAALVLALASLLGRARRR